MALYISLALYMQTLKDGAIGCNKYEFQGMEIQVDFEGRNPQDPDYHGIKILLQQLFLKAHIDLGALTDLIISQSYVGSVVKQSDDLEGSDDDDDDDVNDVFGITTIINVSDRQVSRINCKICLKLKICVNENLS